MSKLYKNIGGSHQTRSGENVPHGAIVKTEEDLVSIFPDKFELVPESVAEENTSKTKTCTAGGVEPETTSDGGTAGGVEPETETKLEGFTDVTNDFPVAKEADLSVKRNKQGWHVFDEGTEPANEKALKKKEVGPFLDEYLKD